MLLRKGRTPNRSWLKGLQLNHNPQIATSREFRTIFANVDSNCLPLCHGAFRALVEKPVLL